MIGDRQSILPKKVHQQIMDFKDRLLSQVIQIAQHLINESRNLRYTLDLLRICRIRGSHIRLWLFLDGRGVMLNGLNDPCASIVRANR